MGIESYTCPIPYLSHPSGATASVDGKTITQECSYDDPVRGPVVWRSVAKIVDDNTLKYEMYITPKGGKEEKMMEMTLTRRH